MWKPTFLGQFLFVCLIKSTYEVDVPGTKSWDLTAKTVPWQAILDLGQRQKWVDLPITFFQLFIYFLVDLQHMKYLEYPFSISAKYGRFSLSTWSKNKNFDLYHKTSIIHFLRINNFYFMVKVKILIFWPCWKWKLAIFCRNGKLGLQIFYML